MSEEKLVRFEVYTVDDEGFIDEYLNTVCTNDFDNEVYAYNEALRYLKPFGMKGCIHRTSSEVVYSHE